MSEDEEHKDLYCTLCGDVTPHTKEDDEWICDLCGTSAGQDEFDAEQKRVDFDEEEEEMDIDLL
jgi:ribosomal protein L37AE/L43A